MAPSLSKPSSTNFPFPMEVLYEIIEHLDKRALKHCALASRVFLHPFRSCLFREVSFKYLDKSTRLEGFYDIIVSSPHVLPYIEELWIHDSTVWRGIFQSTLNILLGEPNEYGRYRGPGSLKKLTLHDVNWRHCSFLSRLLACETLKEVSLQYNNYFPTVNIRYLPPGLKSLILEGVSLNDTATNDSLTAIDILHTESPLSITCSRVDNSIFNHIKSECIQSCRLFFTPYHQENYLAFLRDLPSVLHLSLIYHDDKYEREYYGSEDYLDELHNLMEDLEAFSLSGTDDYLYNPDVADLSQLASLRTLVICTTPLHIYWIATTLKSLSQDNKLEALSLHVKILIDEIPFPRQIELAHIPVFDIPTIKTLRSCQFTLYWKSKQDRQAALKFAELLRYLFEGPGQSFVTVEKTNSVWLGFL